MELFNCLALKIAKGALFLATLPVSIIISFILLIIFLLYAIEYHNKIFEYSKIRDEIK